MDNQENNFNNAARVQQPVSNQEANQAFENHPMGVPVENSKPVQTAVAPAVPQNDPPQVASSQVKEGGLGGQAPKRDNKLLFFIIGAVAVLIVFILIIVISGGNSSKQNSQPIPTPQAQVVTPTPEKQIISSDASEQPIVSRKDLEDSLQEVDKIDPNAITADLNQNDQDAASF